MARCVANPHLSKLYPRLAIRRGRDDPSVTAYGLIRNAIRTLSDLDILDCVMT